MQEQQQEGEQSPKIQSPGGSSQLNKTRDSKQSDGNQTGAAKEYVNQLMEKAESASKVATADDIRPVGELQCILNALTPAKDVGATLEDEYVIKIRTLSQDVQVFSSKAVPDPSGKLKFDFQSA